MQASSLGVEGMVITDLIARHNLPIVVATLDTGALHGETLALIPRIESRYGIRVERYAPRTEATVQFVRDHGAFAMRQSVDLRKACCALRKLEPMERLLAGHDAWVTGLRREQSDHRSDVPFTEIDADGPHQVLPAGRMEPARRLALRASPRRALQRTARPGLPQHRLPALHTRRGARRRLPRRPLVVGTGRPQGMRSAQPAAGRHGLTGCTWGM